MEETNRAREEEAEAEETQEEERKEKEEEEFVEGKKLMKMRTDVREEVEEERRDSYYQRGR